MNPNEGSTPRSPNSGSPDRGEPAFLVIGKLRAPHGLRGELLMEVITDFPERLHPGMQLYIGEEHRPVRLRSRRGHARELLVGFDGFDTPESAGLFRNRLVFVSTAGLPSLPEGEYYHHELIGLNVVSDDDRQIGVVVEILDTAAHDIYVVRPADGGELLIPAIDPVIVEIDLPANRMTIHLLPGLI